MSPAVSHTEVVLQTFELTRRFGSLVAVNSLSLEIRRGEVFGLLGPNGAGKTTTIRMICGLLRPDSGKVLINGQDWHENPRNRYRVGLCHQENILWQKLTCYEQLVFQAEIYGVLRKIARHRAEHLLGKMGLTEKKNKLAGSLSGGLRRRLCIAMAVIHDPDILVFDEPEAGLDPQSRILVREYIMELARQKTVILTTHNMDEAERTASRVAIIDHGQLLMVDTPDNLKRTTGSGDVLEIELPGLDPGRLEAARERLSPGVGSAIVVGTTLVVKSVNMVELLPNLVSQLREEGIPTGELRLRENSLEDVFIHLTGRTLRE